MLLLLFSSFTLLLVSCGIRCAAVTVRRTGQHQQTQTREQKNDNTRNKLAEKTFARIRPGTAVFCTISNFLALTLFHGRRNGGGLYATRYDTNNLDLVINFYESESESEDNAKCKWLEWHNLYAFRRVNAKLLLLLYNRRSLRLKFNSKPLSASGCNVNRIFIAA